VSALRMNEHLGAIDQGGARHQGGLRAHCGRTVAQDAAVPNARAGGIGWRDCRRTSCFLSIMGTFFRVARKQRGPTDVKNGRLSFDTRQKMPSVFVTSRARCSGPTTALLISTRRGKWPEIPAGWTLCGETTDGELALWCSQCSYERRYGLERATPR
jgi:hypothetical protein